MRFSNEIQESLYEHYLLIKDDAYHEKIRFYELNKAQILNLPFEDYLYIAYDYALCLFEVERYYDFLKRADNLIELIIEENIIYFQGENAFEKLLRLKGDACHFVVDYYAADHIYRELIKINKEEPLYQQSFRVNALALLRYHTQKLKGLTIAVFILVALITAGELLIVRSFYENWVFLVEGSRMTLFFLGVTLLIGQELYFRVKINRSIQNLIK